jgi:uncharacterized repeat protein (TIGR03803 family)
MPATLKTLATLGNQSAAPLYIDAAGDLFGTSINDGPTTQGTVFEIVNTETGYATTATNIVEFNGTDGATLFGGLIADTAGDLYSTTEYGGEYGQGTVFEIPYSGGYSNTPTTLADFQFTTHNLPPPYTGLAGPNTTLVADTAGDLFGTTPVTAPYNGGAIYEIPKSGETDATPTILYSFDSGVVVPVGGLLIDTAGDLFGVTGVAGGELFELVNTGNGYAPAITDIAFIGGDPDGGLITDAAGDFFGTSMLGGQDGTVWELRKTVDGYASTPITLASFNGPNGGYPEGSLLIDAAGDLFGTTYTGGPVSGAEGTVYEIVNTSTGYASALTTIATFDGTNGGFPAAGLIADSKGDLFGTTTSGVIFEVTDSGFVLPCFARGTRIATPDGDRAVEAIAPGDRVLTRDGNAAAVVWVGHRHVDCRRHPDPRKVWPVRVRAGAFGPAMPHSDLWLSPDHAVFVDSVLIPVRHLVNGVTIAQEPQDTVAYFHIELAAHDILLAEGLPVESYLDTGFRSAFGRQGSAIELFPNFGSVPRDIGMIWEARACAPLVVHGPKLTAARRKLEAEARTGRCPQETTARSA